MSTPSCILGKDEPTAAKMHQLRVYLGPCQVHPPRLLEPSVFRPQWQAFWSLSKLLGYWKHSAATVALRRSQTRRIVTLRDSFLQEIHIRDFSCPHHSMRSDSIGSNRAPRLAGTQTEKSATLIINSASAM